MAKEPDALRQKRCWQRSTPGRTEAIPQRHTKTHKDTQRYTNAHPLPAGHTITHDSAHTSLYVFPLCKHTHEQVYRNISTIQSQGQLISTQKQQDDVACQSLNPPVSAHATDLMCLSRSKVQQNHRPTRISRIRETHHRPGPRRPAAGAPVPPGLARLAGAWQARASGAARRESGRDARLAGPRPGRLRAGSAAAGGEPGPGAAARPRKGRSRLGGVTIGILTRPAWRSGRRAAESEIRPESTTAAPPGATLHVLAGHTASMVRQTTFPAPLRTLQPAYSSRST